ncbi:hypothetical protein GOTRE_127_00140 [Gordonia terrae NBRC 100016]|uniref:Uncharacterized protein n=1 Tax=Gordonia terrae NBRC 100016 TaxID=1089454 RepID=A0ABQ0HIA3_9ACTN|nr:hypothetical protein GOTRE_127_00140 [Gordonia terrae NBRC 100016]
MSILGIAAITDNHARTRQGRVTRIPIRNTAVPAGGMSLVMRTARRGGMATP